MAHFCDACRFRSERALRLADPPDRWNPACDLSHAELEFIQGLVNNAPRQKSRSRCEFR